MNNIQNIIEMSKFRPKHIRYGQSIFNEAYKFYPNETNKLRSTEYDCFHEDDKVDIFLKKLKEYVNN